jgi:hypothetical protein
MSKYGGNRCICQVCAATHGEYLGRAYAHVSTQPKEFNMPNHPPHRVHSIPIQQMEDQEDSSLPVEPDEGLVPPMIPEDPEYDRMVEPED